MLMHQNNFEYLFHQKHSGKNDTMCACVLQSVAIAKYLLFTLNCWMMMKWREQRESFSFSFHLGSLRLIWCIDRVVIVWNNTNSLFFDFTHHIGLYVTTPLACLCMLVCHCILYRFLGLFFYAVFSFYFGKQKKMPLTSSPLSLWWSTHSHTNTRLNIIDAKESKCFAFIHFLT